MVRTHRLARPTLVALTLASLAAFTVSGLPASASGSPFDIGSDVKVSGAWHCELLWPAVQEFGAHLASLDLAAPALPVVSNVSGALLPTEPVALRAELAELFGTEMPEAVR